MSGYRAKKTGRFTYGGTWDRLCICGHRLGNHTGEAPHSCIESDFTPGCDCECEKFVPAKEEGKK